jgi:cytidine deaminase
MSIPPATLAELKRRARAAAAHAYVPYSRFRVGAAVLCDGAVYSGVNVENASYGLSICAERNAIFNAAANGARRIDAICVYTPTVLPVTPCDVVIVCCTDDDAAEQRFTLRQLLPAAFRLEK